MSIVYPFVTVIVDGDAQRVRLMQSWTSEGVRYLIVCDKLPASSDDLRVFAVVEGDEDARCYTVCDVHSIRKWDELLTAYLIVCERPGKSVFERDRHITLRTRGQPLRYSAMNSVIRWQEREFIIYRLLEQPDQHKPPLRVMEWRLLNGRAYRSPVDNPAVVEAVLAEWGMFDERADDDQALLNVMFEERECRFADIIDRPDGQFAVLIPLSGDDEPIVCRYTRHEDGETFDRSGIPDDVRRQVLQAALLDIDADKGTAPPTESPPAAPPPTDDVVAGTGWGMLGGVQWHNGGEA